MLTFNKMVFFLEMLDHILHNFLLSLSKNNTKNFSSTLLKIHNRYPIGVSSNSFTHNIREQKKKYFCNTNRRRII